MNVLINGMDPLDIIADEAGARGFSGINPESLEDIGNGIQGGAYEGRENVVRAYRIVMAEFRALFALVGEGS